MRGIGGGKEKTVINTTFSDSSLGPQRSITKEAGVGAAQERRRAGPRAQSCPGSLSGRRPGLPAITLAHSYEGSTRCLLS